MKSRLLTVWVSLLLAAHVSGLTEGLHLRLEHHGGCRHCQEDAAGQTSRLQIHHRSDLAGGHLHDPASCSVCRTLAVLHGVGFVSGQGGELLLSNLPVWSLLDRRAPCPIAFASLPGEPRAPPVSMSALI